MAAILEPLEPLGDEELLDLVLKMPDSATPRLETRENSKTQPSKGIDDKREKSRSRDRRKYYRKKEQLAELQQQVATLEQQLHILKDQAQQTGLDTAVIPDKTPPPGSNAALSRRDQLQTMLLELTKAKTALRNESTQLRKQFREATQRAAYLSDMLYGEHKLYSAHASYFRLLTPLSQEVCYQVHAHSSATVGSFSQAMVNAPQTGAVTGWRARRIVDGNLFKFAIEKKFHRINAKAACSQVWTVLLDPLRSRKISADELGKLVRLVQKVDDDNYVFLEELRVLVPGSSDEMIKSALLKSRIKTGNGYRIHTRALDRRMIEMEDRVSGDPVSLPGDLWSSSEQFTWLEFKDEGLDSVKVTFGGILPTVGATAYFWMTEVLMICLRCEQVVLGPRFSLPSF